MMSKEEIQEWIDGEETGRRTKPSVYQGAYLTFSHAWSKALEFAKTHSEEDILEEYEKAKTKDVDNNMSNAGYFKALRMVVTGE